MEAVLSVPQPTDDISTVLLKANINPDLATPAEIAMADRMLQIYENVRDAGKHMAIWKGKQG
jgi:hypothetical protein